MKWNREPPVYRGYGGDDIMMSMQMWLNTKVHSFFVVTGTVVTTSVVTTS